MSDFRLVELRNTSLRVIDGDRGENYPKKSDFSKSGFCIFLNASNVTNSGFDFNEVAFISQERDQLLRKGKAQRNDIVLTTRGTVGNVALYDESVPFDSIRINSGMVLLRSDQKSIDSGYLFAFLRSATFQKQVISNGSGSAQPQLPIAALLNICLPLPTYGEQRKIAAVLSILDAKINLNNRINAELEALAKTIYDYWFVQFDFPDANGRPYKSSGGKMVWNDALKREIPSGWEIVRLDGLVSLVKEGGAIGVIGDATPYVGLEHIPRKSIVLSSWSTADKATSNKIAFQKGDILFGKIRPYFHKVALAMVDGIASRDAIVMRPKSADVPGFALQTVFSDVFVESATASSTGSKMPRADWKVMKTYAVALPEKTSNLLLRYQSMFDGIASKLELHVQQNRELTQLRDWLLPLLMNGQVRVA